ncbi:MAG: sensor histidine kinase [Cyanobacteria bacterium M_DeepCast_100m_m1_067]|nr:sensor histidine kinase [Cyanobacteria bacterium M_DeepCast_100m_m1_067]
MAHAPLPLGWPRRLANRIALASSLQLLVVAGSFGALSFLLGRQSGLGTAELYRQNASVVDLSTQLSRKLNSPIWINQLNLIWLQQRPQRQGDMAALSERFATQMRVFPVDYINFGGADGRFLGVERSRDGDLLLNEDSPRSGRGSMAIYRLGPNGERGPLLERIPGMSATHQEAWYVDTARAGKPLWSSIYGWEDQPEVFSIAYNAPLYGPDRRLQGVVGVDMVLTQLSSWLQGVWRNRSGLALIVEPNGALVASSDPKGILLRHGSAVRRANLTEVGSPVAQALQRHFFIPSGTGKLRLRPGALSPGAAPQRAGVAGRSLTLAATPWGRQEGLNWLLLTALEVGPDVAAAERASLWALLSATAALVTVAVLINRQIRTLLQPLGQLQQASSQLVDLLRSGQGVQGAQPFHSGLSRAAGEELAALDQAIGDLVEQYNRLTQNLQDAQARERFRDAQALALLKDKLRSSLQAAAVAHEINQPLSVLLLTSQMLLKQPLPEPLQQQLHSIQTEAKRVVDTIEQMRALLRNVQTEHQPLNLRDVALSALLYARSSGLVAAPIDSDALEQETIPAWIQGDAAQIQIALVNLLRNAAEAIPQGRPAWIALTLRAEPEAWCLEVADNGPGLPQGLLEQTPLTTTKASGSGLGLFVVHTTMDNHHGRLETATSTRGGALLRLRFPARPVP